MSTELEQLPARLRSHADLVGNGIGYEAAAEIECLRAAIRWMLTEMPVGWQDIASGEGRTDVIAAVRVVTA